MREVKEIKLSFLIETEYNDVCKHWSWRVGGQEWSDCFDKYENMMSNAEHELAWKVVHG